jgi:hypothetical protein
MDHCPLGRFPEKLIAEVFSRSFVHLETLAASASLYRGLILHRSGYGSDGERRDSSVKEYVVGIVELAVDHVVSFGLPSSSVSGCFPQVILHDLVIRTKKCPAFRSVRKYQGGNHRRLAVAEDGVGQGWSAARHRRPARRA